MITVSIDEKNIDSMCDELKGNMLNDLSLAVGNVMKEDMLRQIDTKGDGKWPPVGDAYAAWKERYMRRPGEEEAVSSMRNRDDIMKLTDKLINSFVVGPCVTNEAKSTVPVKTSITETASGKKGEISDAGDTPYPIAQVGGFQVLGWVGKGKTKWYDVPARPYNEPTDIMLNRLDMIMLKFLLEWWEAGLPSWVTE